MQRLTSWHFKIYIHKIQPIPTDLTRFIQGQSLSFHPLSSPTWWSPLFFSMLLYMTLEDQKCSSTTTTIRSPSHWQNTLFRHMKLVGYLCISLWKESLWFLSHLFLPLKWLCCTTQLSLSKIVFALQPLLCQAETFHLFLCLVVLLHTQCQRFRASNSLCSVSGDSQPTWPVTRSLKQARDE